MDNEQIDTELGYLIQRGLPPEIEAMLMTIRAAMKLGITIPLALNMSNFFIGQLKLMGLDPGIEPFSFDSQD